MEGVEVKFHSFLNSALDDAALLSGKNPDARGIGGWMGPRARPDIFMRRNTSCLYWDSNP